MGIWVHSSVVRAADCRSAGPWFKSGCALLRISTSCNRCTAVRSLEHVASALGVASGASRLRQTQASSCARASIAQLVEHALRKRMVVGSIPTGGSFLFCLIYDVSCGVCVFVRVGGRDEARCVWSRQLSICPPAHTHANIASFTPVIIQPDRKAIKRPWLRPHAEGPNPMGIARRLHHLARTAARQHRAARSRSQHVAWCNKHAQPAARNQAPPTGARSHFVSA